MPRLDPYFEKQPPLLFVDELRSPIYKEKLLGFGEREPGKDEIDARGIYIDFRFPDDNKLLDTALVDFEKFSEVFEIKGERYPVIIEFAAGYVRESYRIIPAEDSCRILAGDTEGVRRAIFWLEDEFKSREGAFLGEETEVYLTK